MQGFYFFSFLPSKLKKCYPEITMKLQKILHYLLLATIATLPFSSVRFFVLGVPIYMPELMVIISSALFVWIQCHTDTFKMQKLPTSIILAIAMICVGLLSSAFFNGITLVQLGIIKSWFFFPLLFGWLLFQTLRNQTESLKTQLENISIVTQKVLLIWYVTLVLTALIALTYFFQHQLTYDGRLKAFYLSPNYLALFLFPGVLLGWYFITETLDSRLRGNDKKGSLLFFVTILSWSILCATLYLTLSYTVITAAILGLFLSIFLRSRRSYFLRTTLVALCISFISLFLLFQINGQKFSDLVHLYNRSSLASRIMIWQASERMIVKHPLIGIGPGNFQTTYLEYQKYFPQYLEWAVPHPHNLYLAFWLQTGIIGLIGFLLLCIFWIHDLIRAIGTDIKKAPFLWTLLGIYITLLLIGFLDTPYWKNDLAYEFWLLIMLGLSL
jgi:O-antigen ligase